MGRYKPGTIATSASFFFSASCVICALGSAACLLAHPQPPDLVALDLVWLWSVFVPVCSVLVVGRG